MIPRSDRLAVACVMLAGLLALSACGKKEPTTPSNDTTPPPGKGGAMPPGGIAIPGGGAPNTPDGKLPPEVKKTPGGKKPPSGKKTPGGVPPVGQSDEIPAPPMLKTPLFALNTQAEISNRASMRQISLGVLNHEAVSGKFPVGIADKSGKVGLSWRVAILRYIEQENLYKQFKLDEPWDSPTNKKLIPMMPRLYAPPGIDTKGYTYYRGFTGPDAVMSVPAKLDKPGQPVSGAGGQDITDGSPFTLLIAEATDPVIWTKPDELEFDKTKALPKLGESMFPGGFNVILCDGSLKFIKSTVKAEDLSNAINRRDGKVVEFLK